MSQSPQENNVKDLSEQFAAKLALLSHYSAINLTYSKQIILAQLSGRIILPHGLGLNRIEYQELRKAIGDDDLMHQEIEWYKADWKLIRERAALCDELFAMKKKERDELVELLYRYRNQQDPSATQMTTIITTACLTKFHLWESLGLPERASLGEIIKHNFPELYALNTENMRWKRFFYRQLCDQGGD